MGTAAFDAIGQRSTHRILWRHWLRLLLWSPAYLLALPMIAALPIRLERNWWRP